MLNVSFFGVRGSTPCPSPANARYGGNTACVVLDAPDLEPILFDLGTGLRRYGETIGPEETFVGSVLVTHLHWDHVQGLPFFVPVLRPGARMSVYGPSPEPGLPLGEAFAGFMRPPYFPVTVDQLPGTVEFIDLPPGQIEIGRATVTAADVPHVGVTNGYRVDLDGVSVAYVSDHQQPSLDDLSVSDSVLDLVEGVDLLIHDAQYTNEEFASKCDWGHCTVDYAVRVAVEAGVKRLVLFHHDPAHDDTTLDCLLALAREQAPPALEVLSAYEGLMISLGGT